MRVTGEQFNLSPMEDGYWVTFKTSEKLRVEEFFAGRDKSLPLAVEIAVKRKRRSLNANAYAWTIMDQIAAKLSTTALEVYREIIQRVGVFDYVMVTKEAKDAFIDTWQSNGDGWIAQEQGEREKGYVLKLYKGSSAYDTKQMSRLIDEIVWEAKELGIETMTPDQLQELKERWKQDESSNVSRQAHQGPRSSVE